MATCFISALTFKNIFRDHSDRLKTLLVFLMFSMSCRANFYEGKWTYHGKDGNVVFDNVPMLDDLPWLKLNDVAKRFNLKIETGENGVIKIFNPKNKLEVTVNANHKEVEGFWGKIWLSSSPRRQNAEYLFPLDFGDRVLRPLLEAEAPRHPFPHSDTVQADLIIDPGHGGNDWGAESTYRGQKIFEKNLTLEFAQEIKSELAKSGLKVLLTREDDVYLGLPERVAFANRNRSKLFLSLHLNFDPKAKSHGYEIYLLSLKDADLSESRKALLLDNMKIPSGAAADLAQKAILELKSEMNFKDSLAWANLVDQSLVKTLKRAEKKPVRMGPFYVLYGVEMPALLLELAYLNNAQDIAHILDSAARRRTLAPLIEGLAKSLKKGIVAPQ